MADKNKNVTVTKLSDKQYSWLLAEAKSKALTMTAVIKFLIEDRMALSDGGEKN